MRLVIVPLEAFEVKMGRAYLKTAAEKNYKVSDSIAVRLSASPFYILSAPTFPENSTASMYMNA